jgi:hypothetical protein
MIILKWSFRKWDWEGGVDWIDLAQVRDTWWAVVNIVMKLQVPQNAGNFLTGFGTVSFPRRILSYRVSYLVRLMLMTSQCCPINDRSIRNIILIVKLITKLEKQKYINGDNEK